MVVVQVQLLGAPRGGQQLQILGQLGVVLLLVMAVVLPLCSLRLLLNELMVVLVHCAMPRSLNLMMLLDVTGVRDGITQFPHAQGYLLRRLLLFSSLVGMGLHSFVIFAGVLHPMKVPQLHSRQQPY